MSGAVVCEVEVRAPAAAVYAMFTEPAELVRWIGIRALLEPRPGGTFRFELVPGEFCSGRYVELVPGRRVVFTWGWESADNATQPGASTVEVTLGPDGGGTRVRIVHRDLPSDESRAAHAHGWDHYTQRLALAAAGRDPGADPWATPPGADAEFEQGKRAH